MVLGIGEVESTIFGAEALLRVPEGQSTLEVILKAEGNGDIVELGEWVLHQACLQIVHWVSMGKPIRVSVNVSGVQIKDLAFPTTVARILEQTKINPNLLSLELGERLPFSSSPEAITVCDKVKEMGVGLILDNFGTGYSSLKEMQNLPMDGLKLPYPFIANLVESDTKAIVGTIVEVCQRKGIEVIATGVETATQRDILFRLGCQKQQGFLFGKPTPPINIELLYVI